MADNENSGSKPDFDAYVVEGDGENAFWTKVGGAWQHKDGKGFNLVLTALPVNGRLVMREPKAQEDRKAA